MAVDLRGSAVRRYAPPACLARVSDVLRCQCATQRNGVVVVVSPNGLHSRKVVLQPCFSVVFRSPFSGLHSRKVVLHRKALLRFAL